MERKTGSTWTCRVCEIPGQCDRDFLEITENTDMESTMPRLKQPTGKHQIVNGCSPDMKGWGELPLIRLAQRDLFDIEVCQVVNSSTHSGVPSPCWKFFTTSNYNASCNKIR